MSPAYKVEWVGKKPSINESIRIFKEADMVNLKKLSRNFIEEMIFTKQTVSQNNCSPDQNCETIPVSVRSVSVSLTWSTPNKN
jgi:hypothetical protein